MTKRLAWATQDELSLAYHDFEWGVPKYADQDLFELLSLEGFQSGLNWALVLHRRTALRAAFFDFDVPQVAQMTEEDVAHLMTQKALIRNRRKLEAVITNAQQVLRVQQEFGSFAEYLWAYVDNQPLVNKPARVEMIPTQTKLSQTIAKDLKKRGFKFVGPVIIYSFMQGAGLVDDHLVGWVRPQSPA